MFKFLTNGARRLMWCWTALALGFASLAALPRSVRGSEPAARAIVRGAGTTIIEGGTGSPGGFVPVLTTVAFHASSAADSVIGDFECLARAPRAATGVGSADFTTNVMYVTGRVTGVRTSGDTATLTGSATITGLGAGTDVPFTFVMRKGGPGATAVLTTEGDTHLIFNEVLVEGSFEID